MTPQPKTTATCIKYTAILEEQKYCFLNNSFATYDI